jgi:hypothetical protein
MVEDQGQPEWLANLLRQQQGEEQYRAEDVGGRVDQPDTAEDLQDQADQPDAVEHPPRQMGRADVMEDLREQMIEAEEAFEYEERPALAQFFLNLAPWQRLVLAVLLFLNVALCGCMALVMAGRVMLPF